MVGKGKKQDGEAGRWGIVNLSTSAPVTSAERLALKAKTHVAPCKRRGILVLGHGDPWDVLADV
jgi:hypothetical protein